MTYVVVIHPGTPKQKVVFERPTFKQAHEFKCILHTPADVMKRLQDGTLTTEF